jgi:hypothetical protein
MASNPEHEQSCGYGALHLLISAHTGRRDCCDFAVETRGPQPIRPARRACYIPEKVWTVRLCVPLHMPAQGWPFVQLPATEYTLHERSQVHYELRASNDFVCYFRLSEVEHMRAAGTLRIEGCWP